MAKTEHIFERLHIYLTFPRSRVHRSEKMTVYPHRSDIFDFIFKQDCFFLHRFAKVYI